MLGAGSDVTKPSAQVMKEAYGSPPPRQINAKCFIQNAVHSWSYICRVQAHWRHGITRSNSGRTITTPTHAEQSKHLPKKALHGQRRLDPVTMAAASAATELTRLSIHRPARIRLMWHLMKGLRYLMSGRVNAANNGRSNRRRTQRRRTRRNCNRSCRRTQCLKRTRLDTKGCSSKVRMA